MRLSRACCILAALLLLTSAGAALKLDITSEKEWLTAGDPNPAWLSFEITGGNGPFVITANVQDKDLCTVTPETVSTTSNEAHATVTSKIKSGICNIQFTLKDTKNGNTKDVSFQQKIDHATPNKLTPLYSPEATVGTVVPVSLQLADGYGNKVDNRNIAETVTFQSATMGSGFLLGASVDGASKQETVTVPVNENGIATASFYVGMSQMNAGEEPKYIRYTPPAPLNPGLLYIYGLLNGKPASITSVVTPNAATPPWVFADGTSTFAITYSVFDTNGFPVKGAKIKSTSSEGESRDLVTNELGQAIRPYGPFSTPGRHTVTGMLADSPSVKVIDTLDSISLQPEHLLATGNPTSMPSLDVSPNSFSLISGRVSDAKGNPVQGQKVTFAITDLKASKALKDEPYLTTTLDSKATKYPSGKVVTVTTNSEGNAIVYFTPARFLSDRKSSLYDPNAEGTAAVTALWGTQIETITLTFKRTAFLTLRTKVEPQQVKLDDTFDVTVSVAGDGAMMTSYPIDVMLVTDRSGSMKSNMGKDAKGNSLTRFDYVKLAEHTFVNNLNPGKDKIGLVSFHTWATIDAPLNKDFGSLDSIIDQVQVPTAGQWVPNRGPQGLTNIRDGIFNGITQLKLYGSNDKKLVKAIVVMSDGVWNWGGTPLARGRGYAEKTRLVKWTDNYFGNKCGWPTGCENTYFTNSLYWPGGTSFSMYTYYNPELHLDLQGKPLMTNPGPLYYTGTGLGAGTDVTEGVNGYLCHPMVREFDNRGSTAWSPFMCDKDGYCNNNIACGPGYSDSRFRVDVCDATYLGGQDCMSSEQNMAVYAKNNNVRIYTITYTNSFSGPVGEGTVDVLKTLADTTGGKYYHAATGDDLQKVYDDIASDLVTSAGVNTDMVADSSLVPELQTGVDEFGKDVFQYVPVKDVSTEISKWDKKGKLMDGFPNWFAGLNGRSQQDEWDKSQTLSLPIGSIEIGQAWQMTYRLKALKPGTFNVFGAGSQLTWKDFNDVNQLLPFPETPVTVLPKDALTGDATLRLIDLHTETSEGVTDQIKQNEPFTLNWKVRYTDTDPNNRATLTMTVYSTDGQTTHIGPLTYPDQVVPSNDYVELSYLWGGLEPGKYAARVEASSHGSSSTAAIPITYLFEVSSTPDLAQILIR